MPAPLVSPKPKRNPYEVSPELGDLEFQGFLQGIFEKDPIAKLGFSVDKANLHKDPSKGYYVKKHDLDTSEDLQSENVYLGTDYAASADVWSHEFRHRGLELLKENYDGDPTGFKETYGEDAARLINRSTQLNEFLTEMFDAPEAEWIVGGSGKTRSMSETLDQTDVDGQKLDQDYNRLGLSGLMYAADNMLNQNSGTTTGAFARKISEDNKTVDTGPPSEEESSWWSNIKSKFAKGGTVENAQLEMNLGEEPHEIMATEEETADKIDAKVSEGEYILPANVVRFIGLEKIEKMVQGAQDKLADMASKGRVGGKPTGGKELPISDEELETMEMATGGFVMPKGSARVPFVNDQGQEEPVRFMNGRPVDRIPEGFMPKRKTKKTAAAGVVNSLFSPRGTT